MDNAPEYSSCASWLSATTAGIETRDDTERGDNGGLLVRAVFHAEREEDAVETRSGLANTLLQRHYNYPPAISA